MHNESENYSFLSFCCVFLYRVSYYYIYVLRIENRNQTRLDEQDKMVKENSCFFIVDEQQCNYIFTIRTHQMNRNKQKNQDQCGNAETIKTKYNQRINASL